MNPRLSSQFNISDSGMCQGGKQAVLNKPHHTQQSTTTLIAHAKNKIVWLSDFLKQDSSLQTWEVSRTSDYLLHGSRKKQDSSSRTTLPGKSTHQEQLYLASRHTHGVTANQIYIDPLKCSYYCTIKEKIIFFFFTSINYQSRSPSSRFNCTITQGTLFIIQCKPPMR